MKKAQKFTIGLEIRKLDLIDIISLSVFAVIDIGRVYLNYFLYPEMYKVFYDLILGFLLLAVLISPFLIRFKSVYFSGIWLILSTIYIIVGQRALSFVALLIFLLYHIIRLAFLKKYNREFIPPSLGRGWHIDQYSPLEGRSSGEEDVRFLRLFGYCSTIILILSIFFSAKK